MPNQPDKNTRAPWLPASTAPKDGRTFLAWFPDDESVDMIHWSASSEDPENDNWYVDRTDSGWPIVGEFTHWMELPDGPK